MNEFICKNEYVLSVKMIKELINYYKLNSKKYSDSYWIQKDNQIKNFEIYLSKTNNLNYTKKTKTFFNNLISFLKLDL